MWMADEKSVHNKEKMKEMGTDHRSREEELRACSAVEVSIEKQRIKANIENFFKWSTPPIFDVIELVKSKLLSKYLHRKW